MKNLKKISAGVVLVAALLSAGAVFAAIPCDPATQICNPMNSDSFMDLIQKISALAAKIGTPIAGIFLIWSGFLFVSARGDVKQIKNAQESFKWTVLGAGILMGAWALATGLAEIIKTF